MTSRLPRGISGKRAVAALERAGFSSVRIIGMTAEELTELRR